jgi:hypothetical protein
MRYLLALLFVFALAAAENPMVGTWDCVATPDQGDVSNWTLTVKEVDGKLSGTLTNADGAVFALVDPKLDGNRFVFTVMIGDETYTAENKIDGKKLDGRYKGPQTGAFRGTKRG